MSNSNYDLDENENLESMPENTTIEVNPSLGEKISNFFSKFTQKRLDSGNNKIQYTNKSFDSWERSAAISDFFSSVGEKAQKIFSPVTNAIAGLANKIKESAKNKKYNDVDRYGLNVSTINIQNQKPTDVIMPSAPNKEAKTVPGTIVMAQVQTTPVLESKGIINNANKAKDLTVEELKVDETAAVEKNNINKNRQEEIVQSDALTNQISTGEINVGQPIKNENEKTTDYFEK